MSVEAPSYDCLVKIDDLTLDQIVDDLDGAVFARALRRALGDPGSTTDDTIAAFGNRM